MSKTRLELKVGVFVLIGLLLLAALVVLFSKGTSFFANTIELRLKSANVGGIKRGANILMSGVAVGRVSGTELSPEGTNVTILLKILSKHKIYEDAKFEVEQAGFLGDQYVAIYPGLNEGRLLKSGDEVVCRNPFSMQETVAQAAETIKRIGQVTTNVNAAVADVRRLVLSEEKLSTLGAAVDNFGKLVTDAQDAVKGVSVLVASNTLPVTVAVSNLSYFTSQVLPLPARLTAIVTNNEDEINVAIKNIETASGMLTNLMHDIQSGRGPAARILYDAELADNISAMGRNLAITTSNLNQLGLWGILWKKKATEKVPTRDTRKTPHDRFH